MSRKRKREDYEADEDDEDEVGLADPPGEDDDEEPKANQEEEEDEESMGSEEEKLYTRKFGAHLRKDRDALEKSYKKKLQAVKNDGKKRKKHKGKLTKNVMAAFLAKEELREMKERGEDVRIRPTRKKERGRSVRVLSMQLGEDIASQIASPQPQSQTPQGQTQTPQAQEPTPPFISQSQQDTPTQEPTPLTASTQVSQKLTIRALTQTVKGYKDDIPKLEFRLLKDMALFKQYASFKKIYSLEQQLPCCVVCRQTFGHSVQRNDLSKHFGTSACNQKWSAEEKTQSRLETTAGMTGVMEDRLARASLISGQSPEVVKIISTVLGGMKIPAVVPDVEGAVRRCARSITSEAEGLISTTLRGSGFATRWSLFHDGGRIGDSAAYVFVGSRRGKSYALQPYLPGSQVCFV